MDDKSLPHGRIPVPADPKGPDSAVADRRAFFRRAVAVGIPVVLATVRGRSVHAQGISGCGSLEPSGACGDNGGLSRPGGGEDISKPAKPHGGGKGY
jgi:hypothetical protein